MARRAALALSTDADGPDGTIGVQLLAAIREIFERRKVDALPSALLVVELTSDEEGLWAEYGIRGEPITAKQVSRPALCRSVLALSAQQALGLPRR